jgi:hypothetical protein
MRFALSMAVMVASVVTVSLGQAPWPPGAVAGGTYTVQRAEASALIDTLELPANFTLKFADDVDEIDWTVRTMDYDDGAIIDLSAPKTALPQAASGTSASGVAPDYGVNGAGGSPGQNGVLGRNGKSFTLHVTTIVTNKGTLWIKTDGGPGGRGGDGGSGQVGGGSRCFPLNHGGAGGGGGKAGDGGNGGDTAEVRIYLVQGAAGPPPPSVQPVSCALTCGNSNPPPGMGAGTGNIYIWGAPGCAGGAGSTGQGGSGGSSDRCPSRNCGPFNKDAGCGPHGPSGQPSLPGRNGFCAQGGKKPVSVLNKLQ